MTKLNEYLPRDRDDEHLGGHLERALAGTASSATLAELREHTKVCVACASLLEFGPHLAAKISDPAKDDERDTRAVARVLAAGPRMRRARRVTVALGLSAAALLLGSIAAAKLLGVRLPFTSDTIEARAAKARPTPVVVSEQVRSIPSEVTALQLDEQTPAIADKVAAAPRAPDSPIESAKELFAAANQLRRHGQDEQAVSSYRRLQQAYPQSDEATLSYATLGSLFLQRADAKGALAQFDRYIARGGPVLEDALAGRARALAMLGDRTGEAQAWQTLLDRFPRSVHAARASSRLTELR